MCVCVSACRYIYIYIYIYIYTYITHLPLFLVQERHRTVAAVVSTTTRLAAAVFVLWLVIPRRN